MIWLLSIVAAAVLFLFRRVNQQKAVTVIPRVGSDISFITPAEAEASVEYWEATRDIQFSTAGYTVTTGRNAVQIYGFRRWVILKGTKVLMSPDYEASAPTDDLQAWNIERTTEVSALQMGIGEAFTPKFVGYSPTWPIVPQGFPWRYDFDAETWNQPQNALLTVSP
jgi:hypothetical protein